MPKNGTLFSRAIGHGPDFALDAAMPESARDEDAVLVAEDLLDLPVLQVLGLDPGDVDLDGGGRARRGRAPASGYVGILETAYFPTRAISTSSLGLLHPVDEGFPLRQVPLLLGSSRSCLRMNSSRPSLAKMSGTS